MYVLSIIFFELSQADPLLLKLIEMGMPDIIIPVKKESKPDTPDIKFKLIKITIL